jgi:hypothetical protein
MTNIKYKVYCGLGNKNPKHVYEIINKFFDGATIHYVNGLWIGAKEKSVIIELIVPENRFADIKLTAQALKELYEQETILITGERLDYVSFI